MEASDVIQKSLNDLDEVSTRPNAIGYSEKQRQYIESHYGLKPKDGEILVTRSQVDTFLPTSKRSCCVINGGEQLGFYFQEGFIFSLPADSIPWVADGDGFTPAINENISAPQGAMFVGEYLQNGGGDSTKYAETVVDFEFGKPNNLVAIYDFREIPRSPPKFLSFLNHEKYLKIVAARDYAIHKRDEWRSEAKKLGVQFLESLPDTKIVDDITRKEKESEKTYRQSAQYLQRISAKISP